MKLWHAVFAGLLGLAATSGVAQAQWSSDHASSWRGDRYDRRYDDRYDGYERVPARASARLSRAAHALSEESASLADALHAIAPRSRIARDAMGVALVAERFHRSVESGAPPRVLGLEVRALQRELSQLFAMARSHPGRGRFPQIEWQLERTMEAFAITRDALRDARTGPRRGEYYGYAPAVRAVPPAVAMPVPAPVVRPRARYEVRVGF